MKKCVLLLCLIGVLGAGGVCFADVYNANYSGYGAVSLQVPSYAKFYDIDAVNIKVKPKNLTKDQERNLTSAQKDIYKKVKKIEKQVTKTNFTKALEEDSSFLPTLVQYMNFCLDTNDFSEALNQMLTIQRLNNTENVFDKEKINYKLGMLYYLNRNYSAALRYLAPFENSFNPSVDNLWFALSDIYYNLNDFNSSIFYAKKINNLSQNYAAAQEILYNANYNLKNFKEANNYAKNLVSIDPSPINYMRLGTTSDDNNIKLANYYKAREISYNSRNYTGLAQADIRIAAIEQQKIDNAMKGLSVFVEKPDWNKILKETAEKTDPQALSNRQKEFFDGTNYCIAKYSGSELAKCFESINNKQNQLTGEIKAEYKLQQQERQRELEFRRRQMLIREQTYYQRMYMDDFFYLRGPYWWGLW